MAAPDFYFAINATFRWIHDNWGEEGLIQYWRALGREHFATVSKQFREGGLPAVQDYWQAFFAGEPGGEVTVALEHDAVTVTVQTCPALKHLQAHNREIMALYCRHCTVVSEAMCEGTGIAVAVTGGGGSCRQVFTCAAEGVSP
jgi:hypothetical protein